MNKKLPIISLFFMSIVSIMYWTFKPKDELYNAKWNEPDTTLAITINGEISTTFPTTNAYETSVECTAGTGKVEWNGTKWVLTTSGITKGSTKCNATFNKTLRQSILANNEVKTPLTTAGKEINAYTLNDVNNSVIQQFYFGEENYYITYGTGWEANGTKFNLIGTAVTSDTYKNSYSSLVGKYITSSWIPEAGSETAGTMVTTTNLNSVCYVVSATSSSFTYKEITSNKNRTEALLASAEDDYGTSYYFRGAVKNNYVQFANKCWRIVRIVGDGSVKLVLHNDNTLKVANPCSSANNSTTAAFARYNTQYTDYHSYTSAFNTNYNDNAYVGFKYGITGASDYASAHANNNKSDIFKNLETWYTNNLASYADKLVDTIWCNDKTNVTGKTYDPWSMTPNGLGFGTNNTYYGATKRLVSADNKAGGTGPSLKCNGELSKINSKVGLITADELAFTGYAFGVENTTTYLQENATDTYWWSLSPSYFDDGFAHVWIVYGSKGRFNRNRVDTTYGVRPAISLVSSTTISGGKGTSEEPYVVK